MACDALATYYSGSVAWLRVPPVAPGTSMAGGHADDLVLRDVFYLSGVKQTAKIPRKASSLIT